MEKRARMYTLEIISLVLTVSGADNRKTYRVIDFEKQVEFVNCSKNETVLMHIWRQTVATFSSACEENVSLKGQWWRSLS